MARGRQLEILGNEIKFETKKQKERVYREHMTIDTNYKDIFPKMTKIDRDRPGHRGHRRRAHKTHITMNAMEKRATQTKVI